MIMIVGYSKLNSEGRVVDVIHQECSTEEESLQVAEALVTASIDDETVGEVYRGTRYGNDVVYNIVHEIPR